MNSQNESLQIKELFSSISHLDNEVLETLNREFIKRVLIKILLRLKNEVPE